MQRLLNFDVAIEPRNGGYRTRVLASPAGEAAADFDLPFGDKDLEILILRVLGSVGRARRRARRIESQERLLLEDFGSRLFQAAFSGGVRDRLNQSLLAAESKDTGLRIRLRLPPALGNIPWEYLYDGESGGFVSLSPETALVRYAEMPRPVRPFPISAPLRILSMIAAPSDVPEISGEEEWGKLNAALHDLADRGLVQADRLEAGTLSALQRPLRQRDYHVLHFVGHGYYDEDAQDGALALEGADGRTRLVTGRDLGQMLRGHRSLRLVILNACEGARSARDDPFGGVAQALVRQGIPAVIAMQFEISDPAAVVFSQSFYQAIADDLPVDLAMVEARRAMFAEGHEIEWATPVLYLRSPDGRVFTKGRVSDTGPQDRKGTAQLAETAAAEAAERQTREATERQERELAGRQAREAAERHERELVERQAREAAERQERFTSIAAQLGNDQPAVRLAGVYAMAGLADEWEANRQICVDVLCAYLRTPYEPDPGQEAPLPKMLAFRASREVRHTIVRVIATHLEDGAAVSWQGLNFDFTGAVFDGGDFGGAVFSGGTVDFGLARFAGGRVSFDRARFAGGRVSFGGAEFAGGQVSFGGAEFAGGQVSFGGAEFAGGQVRFAGAEFSGSTADFRGAKFSGCQVSFIGASLSRGLIQFDYAVFSGGHVRFHGAEFSGGQVSFASTRFSGGAIDFDHAVFSGSRVSFDHAEFSGGTVDFGNAADWSFPPVFTWTGTPPLGVILPAQEDQSHTYPA
jgi:uncharacterized protein YjbI with pentapeptide repeats